jgi:hypothetical protein
MVNEPSAAVLAGEVASERHSRRARLEGIKVVAQRLCAELSRSAASETAALATLAAWSPDGMPRCHVATGKLRASAWGEGLDLKDSASPDFNQCEVAMRIHDRIFGENPSALRDA